MKTPKAIARFLFASILLFAFAVLPQIIFPASGFAQASSVELKTTAGEITHGNIAVIETDSITIQSESDERTFSFEQIDSIDFGNTSQTPPESTTLIELIDGSTIQAKTPAKKSGTLNAMFQCGVQQAVQVNFVKSSRFKTYDNDLELSKQWREILEDDSLESDAIVVNRSGALSVVEGLVGDIDSENITFSIGDRTAEVALTKLDAILFFRAANRELAKPVCEIILPDQSRILARKLQSSESTSGLNEKPKKAPLDSVVVTSVSGAKFNFATSSLSRINFQFGRSVYLSNLKPTTNDWVPLVTSSRIYEKLRTLKLARVNKSFSGRPLSLKIQNESGLSFEAQTKQFENGFAIQGGGKLAFALKGQYEQLSGLVGFDPEANPSGDATFSIFVDGKIALEKRMVNQEMKNPIEIDLDVRDAKRIVFQVDYQDSRSVGDQLHLVDLKVSQ